MNDRQILLVLGRLLLLLLMPLLLTTTLTDGGCDLAHDGIITDGASWQSCEELGAWLDTAMIDLPCRRSCCCCCYGNLYPY